MEVGGTTLDMTDTLSNGRSNYTLFQDLVARIAGLEKGTEGAGSDLTDASGKGYEVKSFKDRERYKFKGNPEQGDDKIHTAASSTGYGNNQDKEGVKRCLKDDDYLGALAICKETGFDKNDFYIYTNTRQYNPKVPLRFIIVPKPDVLRGLSKKDPRLISREQVLALARKTTVVPEDWL